MKQRLIGAAILVALAVIFLPMLIKGPAPTSGVSDIPLDMPDAPSQGQFETRELPLVTPATPTRGGALGMPEATGDRLPTVDTANADAADPAEDDAMLSAATAGGDYAVSFGSYQSTADADRVVAALREVKLPGYQESYSAGSRTLHRVRIGPYGDEAAAEAARVRAAKIRDDVGSKVVVLDADAATPASSANAAVEVSRPAVASDSTVSKPTPLPESKPAAVPAKTAPEVVQSAPEPPQPRPAPPTSTPAAAGVGYAVQLGAFSKDEQATALRDRARAAGFSAFVEQVRTDKGMLNRVRVGPVADRAAADQLKAQVSARLGINGFVQSHP